MDKTVEQRVCLKFCVLNGITCSNAYEMLLKAYGDDTLSRTSVFRWYKGFKDGREVVDDLPRPGRPSSVCTDDTVEKVKEMVLENRNTGLREIADTLNMSHETARTILTHNLGMKKVAARLVPKDLNFLQKDARKQVALDMLQRVNSDESFIKRIITGDETWVYEFDMQTSQQSSEWRLDTEPKPKKPRQSRSKVKVMLIVFFDWQGVVHSEFLPEGQTVTKEYYLAVMKRLREKIRQKRPELWENNSWILHHDNAPSHTSIMVREFLAKNSTKTIDQAPYSPDTAPADFFLFPKLKLPLRGRRFESIEDIKQNSRKELMAIPKSAYKECFNEWIIRWRKCIQVQGEYFEGDKINLDN